MVFNEFILKKIAISVCKRCFTVGLNPVIDTHIHGYVMGGQRTMYGWSVTGVKVWISVSFLHNDSLHFPNFLP